MAATVMTSGLVLGSDTELRPKTTLPGGVARLVDVIEGLAPYTDPTLASSEGYPVRSGRTGLNMADAADGNRTGQAIYECCINGCAERYRAA